MSLTAVKMSEDVWLTCLTHALSTETEEIMGLLLGDIEYSKNGNVTALIWGASPQSRSDRRKDRVETNPEQLAAASAQADRMTMLTGRTTRVIGWYHSHPHITVLPSHVDVRTQAMYQLLDSGFIGLIFSCFSEDINKIGRIQVIAFQSSDGKQNLISRPISLSPVNKNVVIDLDSSLSSSENLLLRSGSARAESPEQDTGDSSTATGSWKGVGRSSDLGGFFANADANHLERERVGGNYQTGDLSNTIADLDPMDMSESMQEAMHRSNLDMSGAEYVRKEIPLHVLPTSSLLKLDSPLTSFTDLQHVLYQEERAAYNQAILQNMRDGKVHPLTYIHHTSTYQASMCKLIEYCLSPAINALQDQLSENEIRLAMLTDEAKMLETDASKGGESSSSPRHPPSHGLRGSALVGHRDLHSSANLRTVSSPGSRSRKGGS
ncbi:lys-63-specific deubiquitinase BRCC36 [Pistacia vera]|uniref:lys-63-specific deubiquitinase BRCC36 n=1 Tax=Pistacia vera TaxID=55513 RepID=UPI001262FA4A|nr:lys-63-specific deubiquitinase BRCC36 [Pistacia vera]XP_031263495.1 lys-63-specific deubiquitinase BRCC36 [Pistacia vera]XP_031263496.1 lys-63-specific deubiquitinase BRCC36 [Pistacia vera]